MPPACHLLSGEIDVATRAEILQDVLALIDDPSADWVDSGVPLTLDLGGVSFIDASGIGGLVALQARAAAAGRELSLANVPPRVARLLRFTGMAEAFQVA